MVSDEIFKLRRRTMKHLYRARELSGKRVPWIKVRVKPLKKKNLMGVSISKRNEINVSDKMAKWNERDLKHVVFHELGHKYLGAGHSKDKKHLMAPVISKISDKKIESDFKKLAKNKKR